MRALDLLDGALEFSFDSLELALELFLLGTAHPADAPAELERSKLVDELMDDAKRSLSGMILTCVGIH